MVSLYAHIWKRAYTEAKFCICASTEGIYIYVCFHICTFMEVISFRKCIFIEDDHIWKPCPYMHIYRSTYIRNPTSINVHIWKSSSINVHLRKASFVYAHLWKLDFLYAHIQKCAYTKSNLLKCAFTEAIIRKFAFTEVIFCVCVFMEVGFCICVLPYMRIFGSC